MLQYILVSYFYTQTDRETEGKRERLKNLLWFVGLFFNNIIFMKNKYVLFSVCKIRLDLCYAIRYSAKLLTEMMSRNKIKTKTSHHTPSPSPSSLFKDFTV